MLPLITPDTELGRLEGSAGVEQPTPATDYTVSFVVTFQNRWESFDNPNRWIIRFKDELEPQTGINLNNFLRCDNCPEDGFTVTHGAIDPALSEHYPNYWHTTDYMHHRIIGPVVMTIYESPVLNPGTYSKLPRISEWESPGKIIPSDKMKVNINTNKLQMIDEFPYYPNPNSINPGYPLPGHVMTFDNTGPGTDIWHQYDLGDDW